MMYRYTPCLSRAFTCFFALGLAIGPSVGPFSGMSSLWADDTADEIADAQDSAEHPSEADIESWVKKTPRSTADLKKIQDHFLKILPEARQFSVALKTGAGSGSGVIISPDGLVLTAGHVSTVPNKKITIIMEDGTELPGLTLGRSDFADAGMVKITKEGDYPFALPAETSEIGEWCFVVAHPGGWDASRGSVVRLGRVLSKRTNTMQSDCKLLGGDSGGPLFNMHGEVIGINSRISGSLEGNFHAPIESFVLHWERMVEGEIIKLKGGYFGTAVGEHAEGLEILLVVEGSSAEKLGIEEGDILTHINEERLIDKPHYKQIFGMQGVGAEVAVRWVRDGKPMDGKVKLTEKPW